MYHLAFLFLVKQKADTLFVFLNNCDKTCSLFLIENGNENHYVWIKDLNN